MDIGAQAAEIVWNPADKRSFLHPEGFVAWTEGLIGCDTSDLKSGACAQFRETEAVVKQNIATDMRGAGPTLRFVDFRQIGRFVIKQSQQMLLGMRYAAAA